MQNIQKIHEADPEKNASLTDGQTNRWTERTDFIGLFCKDGSLIMFFGNMRIKFS